MSEDKEAKIRNAHRVRGTLKSRMTLFNNHVAKLRNHLADENNTLDAQKTAELEMRIAKQKTIINEFEQIQSEIETLSEDDDNHILEREAFENAYFSSLSRALDLLSIANRSNDVVPRNVGSGISRDGALHQVKLPTIELPKFNGCYENWLDFRDTFESLIHTNTSIGHIQRFHYLRASLEGSALSVIHSIELSASNYEIAWELLCERYNNRRLLVHNHVKSLFNLSPLTRESSRDIRKMFDDVSKNLRALNSLNQKTDEWDTLIIFIITSKLDKATSREWEECKTKNDLPSLEDLKAFLTNKADLLETLELDQASSAQPNQRRDSRRNSNQTHTFVSSPSHISCVFCKQEHNIYNCSDFLALSARSRIENVKRLRLCLNCLKPGHFQNNCSSGACRRCKEKHNTLLHYDSALTSSGANAGVNSLSCNTNIRNYQTLLSTARVQIRDRHGKGHNCRVLLDSASQSNFITTELCDRLKLQKSSINLAVTGINQISSNINFKCDATILSENHAFSTEISCLVIPKISEKLPSNTINTSHLNIPKRLRLADPNFNQPGNIDLLIGADLFWKLMCIGQHSLGRNEPILQKTLFGWIISGKISGKHAKSVHCSFAKNVDVQAQLERFWSIEETPKVKHLSAEEQACEDDFLENVTRDPTTGRFTVSIPLKESLSKLGDSKQLALKRFYNLERRLQGNIALKQSYSNFMLEYEQMGHMSRVHDTNGHEATYYYMPHHGVLREESLSTKLRVVFDGSAHTTSGWSMNDIQMVGPNIQDNLFDIVLRFRQHRYVITADVAKMYRQVQIIPEHRRLQRILWRPDTTSPVYTYELNTVTYGTAAASYLAIRCLHKLADDNASEHPRASQIIKRDMYVDDLLTGSDTIADVTDICSKVSKILLSGCFDLRKWASNEPKVLNGFSRTDSPLSVLEVGANEGAKTLGLNWLCNSDKLAYKIKYDATSKLVTKRTILSAVSQIFDPLGLLGPCTIVAKCMLQELWQHKLSWDESVPAVIHSQWTRFRNQLNSLNSIEVPRHVICIRPARIEMHGFSDASEKAYGVCIYVRSISDDGKIHIELLCAKTKVAPLKCVSVPRLELCGALLLAQLSHKVERSTSINFSQRYLWCDSTIVLGWIRSSPHLLKTFVANRISEIQGKTDASEWNHVGTNDNPADLCSRGIDPSALRRASIWWKGPTWLELPQSQWPKGAGIDCANILPEVRKQTQSYVVSQTTCDIFIRFSNLQKLQRIVAYCLRFKNNASKQGQFRSFDPLSVDELNTALQRLIKIAQQECFHYEIANLQKNPSCNLKGHLIGLSPFLDGNGILRVGGRLRLSKYDYDKKHPVLLSSKHMFTKLIFRHEHLRLLHASPQLLLASIRERYWPLAGRNLARKIVRNCVTCFRVAPSTMVPKMGNLPSSRVQPTSPFHVSGVDYAGPFKLKDKRGRGNKIVKCYICLFVCFASKAVHLELVSELTTEAFLAALRRFVSRRGKPLHIYSDNGTNFVGADAELRRVCSFLNKAKDTIIQSQSDIGISWHFIPSHSPHFGGLWEAGIKSTKSHLKRVIGDLALVFEDFFTVLVQIEAILNSRPLSPLSSDPNDFNPLTPGHFLIGKPLIRVPEPDLSGLNPGRLSRFQHIQQVTQHFWARWSKEYVSELQQRVKWKQNQEGLLIIGAMVVVKDDNLPPLKWQLARVIALHPGSDGVLRVATVKTSKGSVFKRALSKLCALPIDY